MGTTRKVLDLPGTKIDAILANQQATVGALRRLGLFQHDAARAEIPDTGTADLPAVQVLANAMKAAFNLHLASTDEHVAADATNTVTSAAATDQATSNTLLNEIKGDFNAHIVLAAAHRGKAGDGKVTIAVIATANATDLATSQALAAALLLAINAHFQNGVPLLAVVGS